ncbi:MAG: universal stress protein [Phaeodactylibacter sp.]|nr:universal stress protein [Phaeodactylibacter sp.]
MKSILVPTDFSKFAHFALETAVQLSRIFDSRIHLLHIRDSQTPLEQQREQLQIWCEAFADVDIETHIQEADFLEGLQQFVQEKGIDFIVMGSHGRSGKSEYFVGSNTQKVVRAVNCPVLVVKHPIGKLDFQKVVFASSFSEAAEPAFLHFKDLVKHFLPEIHLVNIHTASIFDPPLIVSTSAMDHFRDLCAPLKCTTQVYRDFNIEQGIRHFSEEIGADLIAVANLERHPLRRMLTGSKVEALINHAEVPVLAIDLPETNA